eukprot:g77483.t1
MTSEQRKVGTSTGPRRARNSGFTGLEWRGTSKIKRNGPVMRRPLPFPAPWTGPAWGAEEPAQTASTAGERLPLVPLTSVQSLPVAAGKKAQRQHRKAPKVGPSTSASGASAMSSEMEKTLQTIQAAKKRPIPQILEVPVPRPKPDLHGKHPIANMTMNGDDGSWAAVFGRSSRGAPVPEPCDAGSKKRPIAQISEVTVGTGRRPVSEDDDDSDMPGLLSSEYELSDSASSCDEAPA